MPTVTELARLEALVKQLLPLTSAHRGELIRAESWNTVVEALIEVARAALAEGDDDVIPAHTHADQVGLGWLEPSLRDLVSRGPLSDPAAVARLAALERQVERLTARLATSAEKVDGWREQMNDLLTRDLVRESTLTSLRRDFLGRRDPAEEILGLRQTLGSVQENLSVALEVGNRLQVDGETVDMAEVFERLGRVEELRSRLTRPDGGLLDASALEQRFTELTNTLVTEDDLDAALDARQVTIPEERLAALRDELQVAVLERAETSIGRLSAELNARTAQSLATVAPTAERAVADALPDLESSILATTRGEIAAAVDAGVDQAAERTNTVADTLREVFNDALDRRIGEVEEGLPSIIDARLEGGLAPRLAALETRLSRLGEVSANLETEISRQSGSLDRLAARTEQVARDERVARREMEDRMVGQMRQVAQNEVRLLENRIPQVIDDVIRLPDRPFEPIRPVFPIGPPGPEAGGPDDFRRIDGVGERFDRRLREAGLTTFTELAALGVDGLAEVLGTSPGRVESADILRQARRLARR